MSKSRLWWAGGRCSWPTASFWALAAISCGGESRFDCPETCEPGYVCADATCRRVCNRPDDCNTGETCDARSLCIVGARPEMGPGPCAAPVVQLQRSMSPRLYVGFTYRDSAVVTPAAATCAFTGGWHVCDAPAGSVHGQGTLTAGCKELDTATEIAFAPDLHGTYRLEYRATSGTATASDAVVIEALADSVFAELQFGDPSLFLAAVARAERCGAFAVIDCPTSDCRVSGTSCEPLAPLLLSCSTHATADECATDPACRYRAETSLCVPDCTKLAHDPPGAADAESCAAHLCTYDNAAHTCAEDGRYSLTQPALVQLFTDGSGLSLVSHDPTAAQYRWDPNGAFAGLTRVGTGASAAAVGMAFAPEVGAAVVPHNYFFKTVAADGTEMCGFDQTLLFWQSSSVSGVPDTASAAIAGLQRNPAPLASCAGEPEATCPSKPGCRWAGQCEPAVVLTTRRVGFPAMAVDGTGAVVRTVFGSGTSPGDFHSLSSDCKRAGVAAYDDMFYSLFALSPTRPRLTREPMPLWLDQRARNGSGVKSSPLRVAAGVYPCDGADDCGAAAPSCTAGACDGSFAVAGYEPRLFGQGTQLVFSHVSCPGGGYACSGADADHDLVLADIVETTTGFELARAQRLAADPNEREVDPLLTGDPQGQSTLYYLGLRFEPVSLKARVAGVESTYAYELPRFRLLARMLTRAGTGFLVTPPASAAIAPGDPLEVQRGSASRQSGLEIPCALAAAGGTSTHLLETYRLESVAELTASQDGRYLAFTRVQQELECHRPFCLFGSCTDELRPGPPLRSDVFVIDLAQPGRVPLRAYPDSCATTLGPVSGMPRFVAGGKQLLFNNQEGDAAAVYRINLDDIAAADCRVRALLDRDAATATLKAVDSRLSARGLAIEDSRTSVRPACAAAELPGWESVAVAVLLALLFLARRASQARRLTRPGRRSPGRPRAGR